MLTLAVSAALAQTIPDTEGSVQTMHLSVDGRRTLWTDDAARRPDGHVVGRGVLSYAHRPLVWEWSDGTTDAVLGSAWQLDAIAAASWGGARLGLDVPLILGTGSDVFAGGGAGLGDLAVDGRFTLLDPARMPLGLALGGRLQAPTATVRVPLGADGFAWELTAIADRELGPVLLAANLGTRGGPPTRLGDVQIDDQLVWRAGAGWEATIDVGLSAELAGRVAYSAALPTGAPVEVLVGGWAWLTESVVARLGVSAGIGRAVGTPGGRVLAVVAWEPPMAEHAAAPDLGRVGVQIEDPSGATAQDAFAWLRCGGRDELLSADQSIDVAPGPCVLEATGLGWSYVMSEIEVVAGTAEEHVLVLEPEGPRGTVRITVTGGAPARWRFDDGHWMRLHDATGVASMMPGAHVAWIEAPGHQTRRVEVQVEPGVEQLLEIALE